jgi:hypothetical protein
MREDIIDGAQRDRVRRECTFENTSQSEGDLQNI